jgi:5'-methylthioadenosine phosphorylase
MTNIQTTMIEKQLQKHGLSKPIELAVIGGSGLYSMDALTHKREIWIETPFGTPSDALIVAEIKHEDGSTPTPCVFLARHARGHRFLPTEVNYRANIWALKSIGVRFIVSVSAVGSLKAEIAPGDLVCPDQFIDRTIHRQNSFFGNGIVGHVAFGDPISKELQQVIYQSALDIVSCKTHLDGTYLCIEGPAFSTKAESRLYQQWGASIIGMTNLPEAKLAREAEIAYATLALATDYDCWHPDHDQVTVEAVMQVMKQNVSNAQKVICEVARRFDGFRGDVFLAHSALGGGMAVMSDVSMIPESTRRQLDLILGGYLWGGEITTG